MAFTFKFPDVGEGMAEGEIVDWLVAEGDEVTEGDSVAEVQNDKSVEEIAAPVSGTVSSILVEAGTVVNVDQPIMVIDDGSEGEAEVDAPAAQAEAPVEEAAAAPAPTTGTSAPAASASTGVVATSDPNKLVQAMPSVRQFARENDIDISLVPATGANGRTTKEDVENFMSTGGEAPAAVAEASTEAEETTETTATPAE